MWGLHEGPCRLLLWLLPHGRLGRPLLLPCWLLLGGPERRWTTLLRLLLLPTRAVLLCWWDVGAILAKGSQHRLRSSCMPHLLLVPGLLLHGRRPLLCLLLLPWLLRLRSSAPVLLPTRLLVLVREGVGLLQAAARAVRLLLLLLLCLLLPLNLLCNGIQLEVIKVLQATARHANQYVAEGVVERLAWLAAELQPSTSCTCETLTMSSKSSSAM